MWIELDQTSCTDHQREQLGKATSGRRGILVGGAGVGKSFATSELVNAVVDEHGPQSIRCVAPTGKAANRLTDLIANPMVRATTLHSALAGAPSGSSWKFERNERNPFTEKFLICDEASMVDQSLALAFELAIPKYARVLYTGDDLQLPSVGIGQFLRDTIMSGQVSVGRLVEVHRNAGLLAATANQVRQGDISWKVPFADQLNGDDINICQVPCRAENVMDVVRRICDRTAELGGDPLWGIQVCTATNKVRERLNLAMQEYLNPRGQTIADLDFKVGDKIIKRVRKQAFQNVKGDDQTVVMNSEFGEVVDIERGQFIVRLVGTENRIVKVPLEMQQGWELAYCCTVHKMQGSEVPTAIVNLEPACWKFFDQSWLYTGITRGKQSAFLVGDIQCAYQLTRRASAVSAKTFLTEMLRGEMPCQISS